jgi:drug/metabolite transporter (DMT)-like permease
VEARISGSRRSTSDQAGSRSASQVAQVAAAQIQLQRHRRPVSLELLTAEHNDEHWPDQLQQPESSWQTRDMGADKARELAQLRQALQASLSTNDDVEAKSHRQPQTWQQQWQIKQQQLLHGALNKFSPRVRGLILLNLLVVLCASNWVVLKESEAVFDPFTFAALRFSVAAAAFAPFLKGAFKDRALVRGGVELGIWSAAGYMTQSVGLVSTAASRASFISTFTVIVVPLLAGLSGRGIRPLTWASAVVALVGVGLLEQGGAPASMGDVWSLMSAIFFGIQVFRTEHYSRAIPSKSNLPLMAMIMLTTAVVSLSSAAVASPMDLGQAWQHVGELPGLLLRGGFPWRSILYTGLLSTDFALWIELVALHDVSSTEAAIIYTMEPVMGALLCYCMLGERWSAAGWVGAGLIIASSLATQILGAGEEENLGDSDSKQD